MIRQATQATGDWADDATGMPGALPRAGFTFAPISARVLFGAGTLDQLAGEVMRAGIARALVLTTPQQVDLGRGAASRLGTLSAGLFAEAAMHTPLPVTLRALEAFKAAEADGIVAIGGGSTIGLGKAIAARLDVPQVVVPTTYAGSEMTPILGETVDGVKTTRSGPEIQPEVVIYDVGLTHGLPAAISVTSGINAMAHAIEALYATGGNPVIDALALEGIAALVDALPLIVADPTGGGGRAGALYGAWLCGICLGGAGMGLHHKLCHTLGGAFGLPHADTHAVILPHALAYNASAVPTVIARLRPILGADPAQGLQDLATRLGAPTTLLDIGMPRDGLDHAADLALQARYPNPRPLERDAIRAMLGRAWDGAAVAG